MSAVAEFLRRRGREELARLSPGERIELALRLGDFDLDLLGAARALSDAGARAAIRRSRQVGRRASRSTGGDLACAS